jgi:hypothetical protein
MHGMIASEQVMAHRDEIVEGAGRGKKHDHECQRGDDASMVGRWASIALIRAIIVVLLSGRSAEPIVVVFVLLPPALHKRDSDE